MSTDCFSSCGGTSELPTWEMDLKLFVLCDSESSCGGTSELNGLKNGESSSNCVQIEIARWTYLVTGNFDVPSIGCEMAHDSDIRALVVGGTGRDEN